VDRYKQCVIGLVWSRYYLQLAVQPGQKQGKGLGNVFKKRRFQA